MKKSASAGPEITAAPFNATRRDPAQLAKKEVDVYHGQLDTNKVLHILTHHNFLSYSQYTIASPNFPIIHKTDMTLPLTPYLLTFFIIIARS